MKNAFLMFLSAVIALACLFALISCADTPQETPSAADTTTEALPSEPSEPSEPSLSDGLTTVEPPVSQDYPTAVSSGNTPAETSDPLPPSTPTPEPTLTPYVDEEFDRVFERMETQTVTYSYYKSGYLFLIDQDHPYSSSGAAVVNAFDAVREEPAPATGYLRFMNKSILGDRTVISAFAQMQHAMKIETGTAKDLVIRACFMTSAEIEEKREDTRFGFCIGDSPSGSEHCAGIAANIAFVDPAGLTYRLGDGGAVYESNWIVANAHRFGLIQRYTKVKSDATGHAEETAHFRYVGIPHATYIKEHNLCFEEYLALLKNHDVGNPLLITDPYHYTWSVYYAPFDTKSGTSVSLPVGLSYTVWGDNDGGYIITVKGVMDQPAVLPIDE